MDDRPPPQRLKGPHPRPSTLRLLMSGGSAALRAELELHAKVTATKEAGKEAKRRRRARKRKKPETP